MPDASKRHLREQTQEQLLESVVRATRLEERQRWTMLLADAARLLSAPYDDHGVLERLARLAVPAVADWVVFHSVDEQQRVAEFAALHSEARRNELLHEAISRGAFIGGHPFLAVTAPPSPPVVLVRKITDAMLRKAFPDEKTLGLVRALAPASMICASLQSHGRTLGALTLLVGRRRPSYHAADQSALAELATLVAVATDDHRLNRAIERERADRERAEAALAQAQSLHQATIESTEDGLLVVDMAGRITSYNRRYLEVWGVPEAIALAGDDEAALALEAGQLRDPEAFVAKVRELYAAPEEESFDTFEFKDGRVFERYSRPQRIGDAVVGRVLSFRDVTQRTHALRREQLLLEASAILTSSLDYEQTLRDLARLVVPSLTAWCQVYLLREDGFLHVAAEAWLGQRGDVQSNEAQTRRCFALDAPHPAAIAARAGEQVVVERDPREVLMAAGSGAGPEMQPPPGVSRSVLAVPLGARGRRLGAMVFALPPSASRYAPAEQELIGEIARRTALTVDNAQLYEAALLANQAKADFLTVMSHELRTPLTAIMGYTELLADGVSGPVSEVQHGQLQRIDASARHLLQLIEAILAFARVEAGREELHLELCELRLVASEVAMLIQPVAIKQGLQLVTDLQPDLGLVRSDPGKIRQILINLLSNAVKFTERGEISLSVFRDGAELVLRVADTGIGIASEHITRIFDPFWQVEQPRTRRVGGTGLGLSVTRHLVRMLGGEIGATSAPGVGSTFTVRLPEPAAAG